MEINILNKLYDDIKEINSFNKLKQYLHNNEKCVYLFVTQIKLLIENSDSIKELLNYGNVCDAYSIYRKFLETFFMLMFLCEHPESNKDFVYHVLLLNDKVMKKNVDKILSIRESHIDNFIEYGYVLPYIDTNDKDRIVMRDVAIAANVEQYFKLYKVCNNFVHNNLSFLKLDIEGIKNQLLDSYDEVTKYIDDQVRKIIE